MHQRGRAKFNTSNYAIENSGASGSTNYQLSQIDFSVSEEKLSMRSVILEHFLTNHDPILPAIVLSMPSVTWDFEKEFRKEVMSKCNSIGIHRKSRFIAFENNVKIWNLSSASMPKKAKATTVSYRYESDKVNFQYYTTNTSKLLFSDINSFLQINKSFFHEEAKFNRFNQKFGKYTAVWLDYTSQLNDQMVKGLRGLDNFLSVSVKEIPFAITFMGQRESSRLVESVLGAVDGNREKAVEFFLSNMLKHEFKVSKTITYQSNGVTMVNVIGIFHTKDEFYNPTKLNRLIEKARIERENCLLRNKEGREIIENKRAKELEEGFDVAEGLNYFSYEE